MGLRPTYEQPNEAKMLAFCGENFSRIKAPKEGMCLCGCGQKTKPAKQGRSARDWIRGRPMRYLAGHQRRIPVVQSFLRFVEIGEGCWNWTAALVWGYGAFQHDNRRYRAHRLAYELTHGSIPDGLFVCHSCDNNKCVRPSHLFLGTAKDNNYDKILKGREAHGSSHWAAKLTEAAVAEILWKHRSGAVGQKRLAKMYGVTKNAIRCILVGKTWRRVSGATFKPST